MGVTQDFGGEEEEVDEGGDMQCYLSRQTKLPYPYCLKGDNLPGKRRSLGGTWEFEGEDREREGGHRKSGSVSSCSITSEYSESLGVSEKTLDSPHIILVNGKIEDSVSYELGGNGGRGGKKFSLLFASSDRVEWSEENIIQSFKELDPVANGLFEAAWTGNGRKVEEILREEVNLRRLVDINGKEFYRDGEGRTPLHLASAWGHVDVVKLLLEKGAPVNAPVGLGEDETTTTPLSCAASFGSLEVVKVLLEGGAKVNAGYEQDGRTALYWAVQSGGLEVARILLESGAKQNLSKAYSETPLHVAASQGDEDCLKLLLDYGADVNLCRGSNRSTALHLSSEEGSVGCVKLLLKNGANHQAMDIRGRTALHVAVTSDADCVIALLKAGADRNAVDASGRTPLHCAVARGSRAAECVRLLVESGADIDAQDNYGYTPLHLSAVNESSQCASILLHHGSDVTLKTNAGTNALSLLVRRIPDVMHYLVDRLDSAVTINDHDPMDPDCEVRLDFRAIVPNIDKKCATGSNGKFKGNGHGGATGTGLNIGCGGKKGESDNRNRNIFTKTQKETEFLTCLLATGNKKILAHPLLEAFLCLKWRRVRKFFLASFFFQIALVILFTGYVVEVYLMKCPHRSGALNNSTSDNLGNMKEIQTPPPIQKTLFVMSSTRHRQFSGGFRNFSRTRRSANSMCDSKGDPAAKALCRWFRLLPRKNGSQPQATEAPDIKTEQERSKVNEKSSENPNKCDLSPITTAIWVLLLVTTSLMAVKEVFQLIQSPLSYLVSSENWGQWLLILSVAVVTLTQPDDWHYPMAACGIFLAWGLMYLQVGRFPAFGLYVQMLGKVASKFGLFILAYACLLLAFALAFCVLIPEHRSYYSFALKIFKVFTMMAGEFNYQDWFHDESHSTESIPLSLMAHLLYGGFVVIVTMVLMNLLVGLAVHDIQGLQKGAKLNRLSRQTALISGLETFIFSKRLQSMLPLTLGSILKNSALLVPSSYNWSFYFRANDPRDKRLPKDIKAKSFRLAFSRHSFTKSNSSNHPILKTHHFSKNHYRSTHPPCGDGFGSSPSPAHFMARPFSSVSHHLRHYSATPISPGPGGRGDDVMDNTNINNLLLAIQHHSEIVSRRAEQRLNSLQNELVKVLQNKLN